jgi:hypothetical protein
MTLPFDSICRLPLAMFVSQVGGKWERLRSRAGFKSGRNLGFPRMPVACASKSRLHEPRDHGEAFGAILLDQHRDGSRLRRRDRGERAPRIPRLREGTRGAPPRLAFTRARFEYAKRGNWDSCAAIASSGSPSSASPLRSGVVRRTRGSQERPTPLDAPFGARSREPATGEGGQDGQRCARIFRTWRRPRGRASIAVIGQPLRSERNARAPIVHEGATVGWLKLQRPQVVGPTRAFLEQS